MIVVDTNVIAYFYLTSEYSALAEEVFSKDPLWVVPRLWRSEFANVLSQYVKRKIVSFSDAVRIFEAAQDVLEPNEYDVNHVKVLALAYESGCSAYDCEFVYLAQDMNIPLITSDKLILSCFKHDSLSMADYVKGR